MQAKMGIARRAAVRFAPTLLLPLLVLGGCGGGGTDAAGGGLDSGTAQGAAPPPASGLGSPGVAAVPGAPQFVYPRAGQLAVDPTQPFVWTAVPGAFGYQLQVGTSPEGNDVFDSGFLTNPSVVVPNLPSSVVLYARVRVIPPGWPTTLAGIAGFPRASYISFRADANVIGARFTSPLPGTTLDADSPLTWESDPLATSYRLTLGVAPGSADLLDTLNIRTALRVVPGLPAGQTVYATLVTNYLGKSVAQSVSFTAGNPHASTAGMLGVARGLTAAVRGMADSLNQPYQPTPLLAAVAIEGDTVADCTAFTNTLLRMLVEAGITLQARGLGVCFNTDNFDCHELVEVYDPDARRWVMLDPTFGLYALNADGQAATAQEVSALARNQAFRSLGFVYLTAAGPAYAQTYYIDYPLLFLNVFLPGTQTPRQASPPLQPYFAATAPPLDGNTYYALGCAPGAQSATANVSGSDATYACSNGFTPVFVAYSVTLDAGNPSGASVWQPRRFVFQ